MGVFRRGRALLCSFLATSRAVSADQIKENLKTVLVVHTIPAMLCLIIVWNLSACLDTYVNVPMTVVLFCFFLFWNHMWSAMQVIKSNANKSKHDKVQFRAYRRGWPQILCHLLLTQSTIFLCSQTCSIDWTVKRQKTAGRFLHISLIRENTAQLLTWNSRFLSVLPL